MDDRSRALLAIGLVVLSAPIWAPFLDVTGSDYVYDHAPITQHDGEISVEPRSGAPAPDRQIACFGTHDAYEDRLCHFERTLLTGNVSIDPGNSLAQGVRPGGAEYLVFGPSGPVYERTFANTDAGGRELGLQRVDPETALDRIAVDANDRPTLERVVENDGIRTNEPILEDRSVIVAAEDGYRLIYEDGPRQFLSANPGVERAIETMLLAIGAGLVFIAGRRVGRDD